MNENQKPLTVGESLIGSFNPDGRKDVEELKEHAARMIDIVDRYHQARGATSWIQNQVVQEAKMQILSAQMMAVKSLFV